MLLPLRYRLMTSSPPLPLISFFLFTVSWFFFFPFLSLLCYQNPPFSLIQDLLITIWKTFCTLLFPFAFYRQCLWSSDASSPFLVLHSAPVILLSLSLLFFVSLPCLSLHVTLISVLVLLFLSLFFSPLQSLLNPDLAISSRLSFISTFPPLKRRTTDVVLNKHTARCFSRDFARHFMCLSIFFLSLPSVYSLETTGRLLSPFRLGLCPLLSSFSSTTSPCSPLLFFLRSPLSSFISSSFRPSLPHSSSRHLSPYSSSSSSFLSWRRRRGSSSSSSYCPQSLNHPLPLSFRKTSLSLREKQGFALSLGSFSYPHHRDLPSLPRSAICPLSSSSSACSLEPSLLLLLSSHRNEGLRACFASPSSFSPSCLSESYSSSSLPCWPRCVFSSLEMTNQSVAHKRQTSIL